jgi:hypothetical protein
LDFFLPISHQFLQTLHDGVRLPTVEFSAQPCEDQMLWDRPLQLKPRAGVASHQGYISTRAIPILKWAISLSVPSVVSKRIDMHDNKAVMN